jgi:glycogen phosphorylase
MGSDEIFDGVVDKLHDLARNLWWSWQPQIRAIFRSLEPQLWRAVHHNPVALLNRMDRADVARRVHDLEMQTRIHQWHRRLHEYLSPRATTWGSEHAGALMARPVAYFSAEFGLHHSIPIYSGGLGVLAGDHLKSMSDLGVPVAAVGLLYHQGYVHQLIDAEGRQQDEVEPIRDEELPIAAVLDADGEQVHVDLAMPGRNLRLRVWRIAVGRANLYLLDARDSVNRPEDIGLTARLYGGDERTRIQQEMILGVGGYRALAAIGVKPSVLHLNEGHSAFALFERARQLIAGQGMGASEALHEVGSSSLFTTHTPVEAGHDRFDVELVAEHLGPMAEGMGLAVGELIDRGREHGDGPFLPTVLALRVAQRVNGVSALHGRVARRMWNALYPGRAEHEVPIGHVTNGVHAPTWLAGDMDELIAHYLGPNWLDSLTRRSMWAGVDLIPDAELWEVHQVLKSRLIAFVRRRVEERHWRLGRPDLPREALAPGALTIGFARRFATYKRADLLLRQMDRLAALVADPERPVQFVFAGKAHPRDEGGKALVQRIANLDRDPRFAGRVVFLENYSMHVARQMIEGVDAWLNNPRRPLEACGTSGQKCVLNGVLQVSILDGWWAEAYDGANGFAIGSGEVFADPAEQDERDTEALFDVLEREVIPLYYERDREGLPRGWIARMKRAMRTLGWRFNADRMVMDYVERAYLPAAGGESARMPRP